MVSIDNHIRRGHPVIFGFIIFFSIIELAISAWLVSRFNLRHDYLSIDVRDRTRYLLFTSCWTIFFSLFYFALFLHSPTGGIMTSVLSHAVFLFLTWVLWTAGAAAITAALGGGLNCSAHFTYCGQLNALEGFAWVVWIFVTFALLVVFFRGISASRRGDGYRGSLIA
ncbi:uncharacterized protein TRAVEDRAFT_157574 [Trametes versicolor FP-101664 SS1]|uniref:uncharacterized protein n=1 Tax=Trametes versicolor (strain FP-101664) TaxID=717944 RepID=UPI0004623062|nr:uncharacterized protein TRAVEDRAFT_157574 [Trametes versicolor FP-101664 SS1]EIW63824.1 hypothetical protein TRAVEDRAFT_157574 [Trametes versicolor FP-101664 SS1]